MLYIFLVETGSMMTFDMNLALQSVANLKKAIAHQCQIPEDQQVLLISGGESLSLSARVCSYTCSGTDTNPIFLFSKSSIDNPNPPKCITDYDPDVDMSDRVQSCIDMNPNYNTVVARAEMAQQLYEMAKQQLHNCERLVHDQHLQQQGWAAVVANLEDIADSFRNTAGQLEDTFKQFIEDKQFFIELLQNKDLKILADIPLLNNLIKSRRNSDSEEENQTISLLEWISQKDNQNSLEQMSEHCTRGLEQFDDEELDKIKDEVADVLEQCNQNNMKEVKGLEERLYGLEKLMCEARKVVEEQRDLAQAFYQNQTRASNLRDPSILPDLCASHQQQLQVMLKHHQKLRDLRRRCARAKEELSGNLHARLRWIVFVEKKLAEVDSKVLIYRENIRRLKKHLEVVHQIHLAPKIYLAAVVEVVRRRMFSSNFLQWATNLAKKSSILVENEIQSRQTFATQLDSHFLQILFPGMNDFPPRFANESPDPFDTELPELQESDVQYLREKLPDLSELLCVPSSVPMPQSLEADQHKEFDSDTEEFETVNNSSANENDPKTTSNIETFKDVFTNMSITFNDYKEIESNLKNLTAEFEEKIKLNLDLQRNCENLETLLNSKNNSFQSLTKISFECFNAFKDFRNSFSTQFIDMKEEYIKTFESVRQQLIDWVVLKEREQNEERIKYKDSIYNFEKLVEQLNLSADEMKNEITSLKDDIKKLTKTNEAMNKELSDKNNEILRLEEERDDMKKKMSLEHELEMTSMSDEMQTLIASKQALEESVADKTKELKDLKTNFGKLESEFYLKFQTEKDVIKKALKEDFENKQKCLLTEFEDKIKQLESSNKTALDELRTTLEQEKTKCLTDLKEKLDSEHRHELDSMRHRFKLAISTTSIERTPSETSLEKVNLDLVDQLAQEREITKLKQLITDEKNRYEELLAKVKKEKDDEIKNIRSAIQAERQVSFNEALNKLSNERDLLAQELKSKQMCLKSFISSIKDVIDNYKTCEQPAHEYTKAFEQIESHLNLLNTNFGQNLNDSVICDSKAQCFCNSANIVREKELEINRLNRMLRESEMTQSSTAIGRIERVSVLGCEVGDIVLIYYEQKFENYIVFNLNNIQHFLHTDCLEALSLHPGSGEARQRWTIAEVTDKEYCQARKAQNRYRVPLNTKFYRVKAKPWSRLVALSNRTNDTRVNILSNLSRSETMPAMAMDSSTTLASMSASVTPLEGHTNPDLK